MLVSGAELERVVAEAPPTFGAEPTLYRYDVLFVKPPMTTPEALAQVTTKPGVDEAHANVYGGALHRDLARERSRSAAARV